MENENIIYGRLLANVDIGGFCFERMVSQLKELLQGDKWRSINSGFKSKSDFIASLKLSSFKISIEQRKELAKLLVEDEGISQRATAKMIGVSNETIRQDVNKLTDNGNNTIEYEEDTENIVNKLTPTGAELVKKEQKKVDKEIKKQEDKKEEEKKKEDAGKIDAAIVDPTREIKLGDIIKLGNHILYCGDAYGMDIKADAIITDPPYGINYEPNWKKWDGSDSDFNKIAGDEEPFNPTPFMKYKTMLFFGANYYNNNLPLGGWLVWDKRTDEVKDKMIGNPFELAWFISQHTDKKAIIKRILHGGVVNADSKKGNNEKRYHPTQKPIFLLQSIIEEITLENEVVFDPFAGSGSTLLACELSNRNCRAIEIDPKYCSIIISRWEEATNNKAIWMQV